MYATASRRINWEGGGGRREVVMFGYSTLSVVQQTLHLKQACLALFTIGDCTKGEG